ncbi:MAG: GNAT family N-acetyltransferase [Actinomycetota bacterium]
MNLTARPAVTEDAPLLAALAAEAVDEQRDARGGPIWSVRETRPAPYVESFAASLADEDELVIIGELDGTPLGYGAAHTEELRDGSRLGVISDLFVLADARGVGLGEEIMTPLVQWCSDRGCRGIDALALPGNRSTKNFFETFGFTARALVVHHVLDHEA